MKVEYRITGAGGSYAVLFDDSAGDTSEKYEGQFKDKSEMTPGFGSGSVGITPNANTASSIAIPLARVFTTPGAAQADMRGWRSALKGKRLNLKVTYGADVEYYPSAVLGNMSFKLNGQAVDYVFNFDAQDVTANEPA